MNSKNIKFKLLDGQIIFLTKINNPRKAFVAQSPPLNGFFGLVKIRITDLFEQFTYKERAAIIYHELWHRKNNEKFEMKIILKRPLLLFFPQKIRRLQEYEADMWGARKAGFKNMHSVLVKLKKLIKNGTLEPSHEKSHPPIRERIKRIEEHL